MCEPQLSLQGDTSTLQEGAPIVQEISLVTKPLLKSLHPYNKTRTRTFIKEQGVLCVATADETLAAVAGTAAPARTHSSNKDVPL